MPAAFFNEQGPIVLAEIPDALRDGESFLGDVDDRRHVDSFQKSLGVTRGYRREGEQNGRERNYGRSIAADNAESRRSGCDRETLGKQLRFVFSFNHHSLRMEQIKLSRAGQ